MTLAELDGFKWLEPWEGRAGTPGIPGLEKELQREVGAGHALYHLAVDCRAVARRMDTDDVLFAITDGTDDVAMFAEVHLTWPRARESLAPFPWTVVYRSFEEWVEQSMKPTAAERDQFGSQPASPSANRSG